MADEALNIFISYSHQDEGLKDELVNYHLKLLQREGKINTWQDRDIEAGAVWDEEIRNNLDKADIILMLVTRHFLASEYCYAKEMMRAIKRHEQGTARVISIILGPCTWQYTPFQKLQVLPKDGKPVTRWADRAEAFVDVELGIRRVVDSLIAERQEVSAAKAREAEALEREQAAARQEQERLEQERLAEEQRQREQAEAQRREQERQEQERLAEEQRQREAAEAARREQERLEQERQEQERLVAEQRQREEAEAQRIEQKPQQQEAQKRDAVNQEAINDQDPSSEAVGEPVEVNNQQSESVKQKPRLDKMTMWEIPLNRRSTLWWLVGGIGGLLFWGATSGNGTSQTNSRPSVGSSPSSSGNGQDSGHLPENIPSPDNLGKALKLKTFSFPVVSLNAQGEEIRRVQKENKYFVEDLEQGISLDMVAIPGGSFLMGSPDSEGYSDEKPQHRVTVKPFFMGKFAVTQAQWLAVAAMPKVKKELNPEPSTFKGLMRPVEEVSWHDAVEFCQRLSQHSHRQYRLPSEAEWGYACRAGTTAPFSFGPTITTDFANFWGTYTYGFASKGIVREETTDVGSFSPNAYGLYDMHGNVWEWCQDHWHNDYYGAPKFGSPWVSNDESKPRLLRGGSWYDDPRKCRSASRYSKDPDLIGSLFGFRVVCAGAAALL